MSLSRQQLLKLSRESKAIAEWTTVRDFAAQIYGEGKAAKIETDTYGEYNDEGGTNYYIESITATDAKGEELDPDYSLPFFQTETWKRYDDDDDDGFISKIREFYLSDDERAIFVAFDDLPREDAAYDLTTPPVLTLPTGDIA